jgi:phosphoribosyl-ATP pyrophosphohydrolase
MDNKFEILNEILDLFYWWQIMFYINNIIDTFYQIFAQHGMIIK